jgi:hypothetical protein
VGNQQQTVFPPLAPGTDIAVTQLHKVDWPVELILPATPIDFRLIGIDLYKRTWADQWKKRKVLCTDVPEHRIAAISSGEKRHGYAPAA